MRATSLLCIVMLSLSLTTYPLKATEVEGGTRIDDFSLRDYLGKLHSFGELSQQGPVVVAFLGNECPLANLYAPRLESLVQEFSDRDIVFVGVNSNLQDTPTEIGAYARRHGLSFPILKDPGNKVADAFGAVRTPEVFLLDDQREVRYRGRIDDQYVVGARKTSVGRRDLAMAIEELLDGQPVTTSATEALGCFIGRVSNTPARGDITFSKHIAPIFNRHCVECHREGELGPFPLTSYEEVEGWGETIREVVSEGRMPPWFADPDFGHFANDSRMTEEERHLLFTWVENGCPEGNPADLPESPTFVTGWRIGEPDAIFQMPDAFTVPAEGTVDYKYFLIDAELDEDVWITNAEARPGNSAVVHHIVMYAIPARAKQMVVSMLAKQPPPAAQDRSGQQSRGLRRDAGSVAGAFGQMVAIYAPGMPPWQYPPNTAMLVEKGSVFLMQMHYTPNGTEQSDQSYVGFRFAKPEDIKKRIRYGMAVNTNLQIPPHEDNYRATASHTFGQDTLLLNLFPHMHYRGKSFRFEAVYQDKTREVLLDVPRYDFNWQLRYDLTEPKLLPKGTTLECTAHFDNSEENLFNPDPSRTVRFGLQSWEEMLVGYYTVVRADEDLTKQD